MFVSEITPAQSFQIVPLSGRAESRENSLVLSPGKANGALSGFYGCLL
jgi:hypothetical protein